jgi:hypothetical protein
MSVHNFTPIMAIMIQIERVPIQLAGAVSSVAPLLTSFLYKVFFFSAIVFAIYVSLFSTPISSSSDNQLNNHSCVVCLHTGCSYILFANIPAPFWDRLLGGTQRSSPLVVSITDRF